MAQKEPGGANTTKSIITEFEATVSNYSRRPSLRFVAGLLGISHNGLRELKAEKYPPKLENLLVSKKLILAAYHTINKLIANKVEQVETEDLVVAEANE